MNDWKKIALLARRSLIALTSALLIAVALYAGSSFFKDKMRAELAQMQQLESATQATLLEKQADLASLQEKISRFKLLREQGMVGKADREGWVEQLTASHHHTGLPNTWVYSLQAPKPLTMQASPAAGAEIPPPGDATGPLFYDLDIELGSIHEEELLTLLQNYQTQVKGRYRVHACTLSDRTEAGLSARCTLRFFTLPDTGPEPSLQ